MEPVEKRPLKRIVIVDNYGDFPPREDRIRLFKDLLFEHGERLGIRVEVSVVDAESNRFSRIMKAHSDADAFILTGSLDAPTPEKRQVEWIRSQRAWLKKMIERPNTPPILGICFGHQILGSVFGSALEERKTFEDRVVRDFVPTKAGKKDPLVRGEPFSLLCNHGFQLKRIPEGFVQVAWAGFPAARVQFIRHKTKPVWGIQGHPEAGYIVSDAHPVKEELQAAGDKIFSRFLSLLT